MDSITPVRAWAEYDEWSPYLYPTISREWSSVCIPKTGRESHVVAHGFSRTLPDWFRRQGLELGSLRSLRVLFSNGAEVELWFDERCVDDRVARCTLDSKRETIVAGVSQGKYWDFMATNLTDAEAVKRALAEAIKWLEENVDE